MSVLRGDAMQARSMRVFVALCLRAPRGVRAGETNAAAACTRAGSAGVAAPPPPPPEPKPRTDRAELGRFAGTRRVVAGADRGDPQPQIRSRCRQSRRSSFPGYAALSPDGPGEVLGRIRHRHRQIRIDVESARAFQGTAAAQGDLDRAAADRVRGRQGIPLRSAARSQREIARRSRRPTCAAA